jgi:hypothetical protein
MFLTVLGFGVVLPFFKGLSYLDPMLLIAASQVSLAFTGPLTLYFLQKHHPQSASMLAALSSHLISVLTIANGFLVVNLRSWLGQPYLPPSYLLLAIWICNFSLSLLSSIITAIVVVRWARTSRGLLVSRILLFLVVMSAVFGQTVFEGAPAAPVARLLIYISMVALLLDAILIGLLRTPTRGASAGSS